MFVFERTFTSLSHDTDHVTLGVSNYNFRWVEVLKSPNIPKCSSLNALSLQCHMTPIMWLQGCQITTSADFKLWSHQAHQNDRLWTHFYLSIIWHRSGFGRNFWNIRIFWNSIEFRFFHLESISIPFFRFQKIKYLEFHLFRNQKMEFLELIFFQKSKNWIFGIPIFPNISKWNIWNSINSKNLEMEYLEFQFIPKKKIRFLR